MGKELDLFKEIWRERPHYSEVSGEPLDGFSPVYFSHILTKGAYPEHRLNKENIVLKTYDEHRMWESGDRDKLRNIPMWKKVFDIQDKMKTKIK